MNKIFWLQPKDTMIGKGQQLIKEKTGSYSFCALPWIHMATRPNGDVRLCCGSNASGAKSGNYEVGLIKKENGQNANFGVDTPLSAWNNEYMRSVRKTMLEGKIPASCTKCFEEEAVGVASKRLWEMHEWTQDGLDIQKLIEETTSSGEVPNVIRYFDLRLGHTCNLKCIMCTPHDSSSWIGDQQKIIHISKSKIVTDQVSWDPTNFNNFWHEKKEFWGDIFDQIPYITQLYFAGGEPLLIKEHTIFLKEIIKRGYSKQISLRYNSNGIFVNQKILDIWAQFKRVRYAFSIDALFERNEYIRFPTQWNDVERSLRLLDNAPDNIHCSIACTVQAMNINHIIDFAKWKISKNFKKINKFTTDNIESGGGLINLHLLYLPTFLSARILPKEDKEKLLNAFAEFKIWLWNNYTQDNNFWQSNPYGWKRWEAILNFVLAEDHSQLLPDFKEYISNLDQIRGTNSKKIFPELENLL